MSAPTPPRGPGLREALVVLLLCALAVCAYTWPLAADLQHGFLTGKYHWSHAWALELANAGLHNPGFLSIQPLPDGLSEGITVRTQMLEWPRGGPLVLIAGFNLGVGVLLRQAMGLVPSFNISALLSLTIAPWAAWLLARRMGARATGAAVAALAFGFGPYVTGLVHNGQLAKYNHGWIALLLLCAWEIGRRGRWWLTPLVWLLAVLCLVSSPYYFVFSAAGCALLGLWGALRAEGGRRRLLGLGSLVAAALGSLALCAPLLRYYLGRTQSLLSPSTGSAQETFELAASLWELLLPLELGSAATAIPGERHFAYLGLTVLALAGVALWSRGARRDGPLWALLLVFGVLAMGREATLPLLGTVTMPLGWLTALSDAGSAIILSYRMVVVAMLAAAVLAALGLDALLARLPRQARWLGPGLTALVGIDLMLVSGVPFPHEVQRIELAEAYLDLARDPEVYGVLEFPCELGTNSRLGTERQTALARLNQRHLFHQGFHHKGLGIVDKGNEGRAVFQIGLMRDLVQLMMGAELSEPTDLAGSLMWLEGADYRALLLHEAELPPETRGPIKAYLERALGSPVDPEPADGVLLYRLGQG